MTDQTGTQVHRPYKTITSADGKHSIKVYVDGEVVIELHGKNENVGAVAALEMIETVLQFTQEHFEEMIESNRERICKKYVVDAQEFYTSIVPILRTVFYSMLSEKQVGQV